MTFIINSHFSNISQHNFHWKCFILSNLVTIINVQLQKSCCRYITVIWCDGTINWNHPSCCYSTSENMNLLLNKENTLVYLDAVHSRLCWACPSFYQVTGSFLHLKPKYGNMTRIITWLKFRTHTDKHSSINTHTCNVRNTTAQSLMFA